MEQGSKALNSLCCHSRCGLNQNRAPENMQFERIVDRYLNERKSAAMASTLLLTLGLTPSMFFAFLRAQNSNRRANEADSQSKKYKKKSWVKR
jgi:hypothetical protein